MPEEKQYSQAVADLFPETDGYVIRTSTQISAIDALKVLYDRLTGVIGKEEARNLLTESFDLSPHRPTAKGRQVTLRQRIVDAAWCAFHDKGKAAGASEYEIVRRLCSVLGTGPDQIENVGRRLRRVLKARQIGFPADEVWTFENAIAYFLFKKMKSDKADRFRREAELMLQNTPRRGRPKRPAGRAELLLFFYQTEMATRPKAIANVRAIARTLANKGWGTPQGIERELFEILKNHRRLSKPAVK